MLVFRKILRTFQINDARTFQNKIHQEILQCNLPASSKKVFLLEEKSTDAVARRYSAKKL